VHFACTSRYDDGIKTLVEAGAEVDVKDKFGRMPIHFAASAVLNRCFEYLLETQKQMNIDAADHDGWTPLLWAARSGDADTVSRLVAENADVWVRGRAYGAGGEWSALKLLNFSDRHTATTLKEELKPKERIRTNSEGEKEEWNDYLHDCRVGDRKNVACKSCLVVSKPHP
jgi:ankyrin repeat protein